MDSTIKVQGSNGSEKASIAGFLHQVENTQVEVPKTVLIGIVGHTNTSI